VEPAQTVPHAPQFAESLKVFTQPTVEPQKVGSAAPQPQAPTVVPEQVACGGQRFPHPPQLLASTSVFTHCGFPLQSVEPGGPPHWQAPEVQVGVPTTPGPAQTFPHVPQWSGSSWRFTQAPGFVPQTVVSATGQAQVPPEQVAPVGHRWPHAPQLLSSEVTSMQEPQQVFPAPQVIPHPPQFEGSVTALTHFPSHSISGEVQADFFGAQASAESPAISATATRVDGRRRPSMR
jgi:hypothetical protein